MSDNPKSFALLIDGDNVQAALVSQILDKVFSKYGKPIIKKVYINSNQTTHWQPIINDYSLEGIWVSNNTTGKNASDIALVIDAMELLYNNADLRGFCVISSDSDFTRLASYIVGKNKYMLGIGRKMTPTSFVNACSKFDYIEDLLPSVEQSENISEQVEAKPSHIITNQTLKKLLIQAYERTPKVKEGWVQLAEIRTVMNTLNEDFQSSEYQEAKQLVKKVKELAACYPGGVIEILKQPGSKPVTHHIRIDCDTLQFIETYKHIPVIEKGGLGSTIDHRVRAAEKFIIQKWVQLSRRQKAEKSRDSDVAALSWYN